MVGAEDLNARPDLRAVADRDLHDVEDRAVKVEEDTAAEVDVEAVVAMERRTLRREERGWRAILRSVALGWNSAGR